MSDFIIENGVLQKYKGRDRALEIPEGVAVMADDPFEEGYLPEKITFPKTLKRIEWNGFLICKAIKEIHITDVAAWCGVEIAYYPDSFYRRSIDLYLNGELVEHLKIPDTVTKINKSVFADCRSVVSIDMGRSVTEVEKYAFHGCSSVKWVNVADISHWLDIKFDWSNANPLSYSACLCVNGEAVKDLTVPEGIKTIKNTAFIGYKHLESVRVADSVTCIESSAFQGCTSLKEVYIPEGVTHIGGYAFAFCDELESISFPDSVTELGGAVLYVCRSLLSVKLPSGIREIYSDFFKNCCSLKKIAIPHTVEVLGSGAFDGCEDLESVEISDLSAWCNIEFVDQYSNPLCYAKKLVLGSEEISEVIIPDDVSRILDYTFFGFGMLKSVVIPPSVSVVGYSAFSGCDSLEEIHISDLSAWCNIDFLQENNGLYNDNTVLYLNGTPVSEAELSPMLSLKMAEYAARWKIEIEHGPDVRSGQYNSHFGVRGLETVFFTKRDVVTKNGIIIGFNVNGETVEPFMMSFQCDYGVRVIDTNENE